jgi:hypothetical protein
MDVNAPTQDGHNALHLAAEHAKFDIVRYLRRSFSTSQTSYYSGVVNRGFVKKIMRSFSVRGQAAIGELLLSLDGDGAAKNAIATVLKEDGKRKLGDVSESSSNPSKRPSPAA